MMPAFEKAFDLWGDDIVDLSTENKAFENKIGSYVEKFKAKFLKQIDDEQRAKLIMSRMQKQMNKQY